MPPAVPSANRAPGLDAPARPSAANQSLIRRVMAQAGADVADLEAKTLDAMVPVLRDAREELRAGLTEWLANAPDGNERFTAQQLRVALLQVEGALERAKDLRPAMFEALKGGSRAAGELAVDHLEFQVSRFASVFGMSLRPIQIQAASVVARGNRLLIPQFRTSAARYAGAVREDIRHQLALGLARGETFHQLTNRLVRLGGPKGMVSLRGIAGEPGSVVEHIAEGLFRRHRFWAERLVRTEIVHAYNLQHEGAIDELNGGLEDGEEAFGKRWDATSDSRLCPICDGLDGEVVVAGAPFPGGYERPPGHPLCRCTLLAWHPSWAEDLEPKDKPESADQRRRPDAKPPATPATPPDATGTWEDHLAKRRIDVPAKLHRAADDALKGAGIDRQAFLAAFEPPAGHRLLVQSVEAGYAGGIGWGGVLVNSEGVKVGSISRTLYRDQKGRLVVKHGLLELKEQGTGVGNAWIARMFAGYEAMGVYRVELSTAWVGNYNWAKVGFRMDPGDIRAGAELLKDRLARHVEDGLISEEAAADYLRIYRRDPTDFARLEGLPEIEFTFRVPGGRVTTKGSINKAFMMDQNSLHWDGRLEVGTARWKRARKELDAKAKKKK